VISYRNSIGESLAENTVLLRGTLDLLILQTLRLGPNHGLGISRRIEQITQGTFAVRPGSLFPALHRLEEKGWLSSHWSGSENNRKARYYQLTAAGKRQLKTETENWDRVSIAIARALKATS
jgi:transcriptional regulator